MKIYLIRHGQSTNNAEFPRVPDPPLTELGQAQAECTAALLRAQNIGAAALYVSPMRRALETARHLQAALDLPPQVLPELCEADGLREHTGLCRAEILREWPTAVLDAAITEAGWWTPKPDEAEGEVYARAARAIAALRDRHQAEKQTIAVVTHGTFGSALISVLLGLGPAGYRRFDFYNCALSRVDIKAWDDDSDLALAGEPLPAQLPEKVRVLFHNSVAHLDPSLIT